MTPAESGYLTLSVLGEKLAICRLDPDSEVPAWAGEGSFSSVTRTSDELSAVCPDHAVPPDVVCERGWRALKLEGPFALDLTGVLVSVASPLSEAGLSVFAIATYDTDYVLVNETQLERAISVLSGCSHTVNRQG